MPYMQEMIHKLEVGPWMRHLKIGLAVLALLGMFVGYNWRNFRNMGSLEAMDSAQVARQLSEGKGFSTLFVRQLSVHLVKQRNEARAEAGATIEGRDHAMIKEIAHPDLANPPVYPVMLAALMKVLPMNWEPHTTGAFWTKSGRFARYQPDFLIALMNEGLFLIVVVGTFFLARRLFDPTVAWTAALLLLGCEMMWRFAVSGLSTIVLLIIFLGLAWLLVLFEAEAREPKRGPRTPFLLVAAIGAVIGLGVLTRYSFGWLLIPVVAYVAIFGGVRRGALCLVIVGVFALVISPWVLRNLQVSGLPFGTATFAILEGTPVFPEHTLQRTLEPSFKQVFFSGFIPKLLGGTRTLLQNDLPKLGGSWLSVLFIAGLLLGFRNPAIRRLRYFILMCLGTLIVVQALGRTQLSADCPEFNSENVLVLLVPLVFIYGVALFYMLLDQMNLPFRGFRLVAIGVFSGIMSLPLVYSFLPPQGSPLAYPPYHPMVIRQVSALMNENELLMSDVPWAVAWYGQRQCIWLSRSAEDDYFAVNDFLKPVRALYLTQITMDSRFASDWLAGNSLTWGRFVLAFVVTKGKLESNFPLRHAHPGLLPQQFFLTDRTRWKDKALDSLPPAPGSEEKDAEKKEPASGKPAESPSK